MRKSLVIGAAAVIAALALAGGASAQPRQQYGAPAIANSDGTTGYQPFSTPEGSSGFYVSAPKAPGSDLVGMIGHLFHRA